jgi:hypothetical protein
VVTTSATTLVLWAGTVNHRGAQRMFLELLFSHKEPELLDGIVQQQ